MCVYACVCVCVSACVCVCGKVEGRRLTKRMMAEARLAIVKYLEGG